MSRTRMLQWATITLVTAIAVVYLGAFGYLKLNESDLVFPRTRDS